MRQKKGLIILVVILLALCGVYFGLKSYNKSQAKKEDQKEKEKTIQVLDIKNPVEITYSADDGSSMSFVKEDGTWYLKNDKETALVQDTIQDIADTVSDVKAEKQIKDPDPLESYGLNEASYTIIVTGENGDTGTLYIGDGADSDYYLTDKEKQNVYLVLGHAVNLGHPLQHELIYLLNPLQVHQYIAHTFFHVGHPSF